MSEFQLFSVSGFPRFSFLDAEASPTKNQEPRMKAYEEVAEFIARRGPREVAELRPSQEARERVSELLDKEKTEGLSREEQRELALL